MNSLIPRGKAALVFLLALFATVPTVARSQDANRITVSESGQCDRDQLKNISGASERTGLGYSFLIDERKSLFQGSGARPLPVTAKLELFARVYLWDQASRNGKVLISSEDLRVCGWVEPDALLLNERQMEEAIKRNETPLLAFSRGPNPIEVRDGPSAAGPERVNRLKLKVVLHNLNSAGKGIAVYNRPGGENVGELRLFDIFEAFQHRTATDGPRKGVYYLVGSRVTDQDLKLVGWLHEEDVHEWTNRMAVYWAERSGATAQRPMLSGYSDPQALRQGTAPLTEEPPNSGDPAYGLYRRFPLLESEPTEAEIDKQIKALRIDRKDHLGLARLVTYYRIAVPGKACDRNRPQDCISPSEVDDRRREIVNAEQHLHNIDVLFLIDATDSMNKYFPIAAAAVSKFADSLAERAGQRPPSVFVGAAIYGDYKESRSAVETVDHQIVSSLADMQNRENARRFAARLNRLKPHQPGKGILPDRQEDLLEAPFAALIKSAQSKDIGWRTEAGFKVLIHIADAGNRDKGKSNSETLIAAGAVGMRSSPASEKVAETLGVEDVVVALKNANIYYFPIPVAGAFMREANHLFVEQATSLIRQLAKADIPVEPTYDRSNGVETDATPVATILGRIESAYKIAISARAEVTQDRTCGAPPSGSCTGQTVNLKAWEAQLRDDAIKRAYPNPNQQKAFYDRVQNVVRVYVRPFQQQYEMLSYWIAMDEETLVDLTAMFRKACTTFEKRGSAKSLFETIRNMANVDAGEWTAPGELIRKQYYIPNFHLHPVLSLPEREIEAILRDPDDKRPEEWKQAFCRSEFLLDKIRAGKRVDTATLDFVSGTFRARGEQKFDWMVKVEQGRGLSVFYVPLDYLP
jgi:hypothetical protein